ncbi:HpcH/HpaI aldolase/citrate lyase family protein [Halovenus sp. WSH3]|uniref:HpcH/HpaI aldolase/citrate lyase family protein n=1 Tax=Halovenus carboxidivorans TaxID=2692199 RepID=A0A6B0SYY8_9EURY|nr:CoA ester lyase [Halovenus carboxidivorans]MXR50824.1 HpcH/HpaI aldolase/citrate lyase family protein [Halovenus carboxidivorans]
MARRSVLFSPGDQPELLRKAPESGADVVVFDLEDAVAPSEKSAARDAVVSVLDGIDPECELCVRINPIDGEGSADLAALADAVASVDSVVLPKVSGPDQIERLHERFDAVGWRRPILALLETAAGVLSAERIGGQRDVEALLFGAEDLAADIGATRTDDGEEIGYARQRVVLAASSAGVDCIDTLVTDFERTEYLETESERAVQFGFDGKMAIHPAQVSVINEAFTPDRERIEWAERVLAAKEQADQEGKGVFAVDGEMIDAPLIAQAEQVIERATAAGVSVED